MSARAALLSARAAFGLLVLVLAGCGPAGAATLAVELDGIDAGSGPIYVGLCQNGLSEEDCRIGQDAPARNASQRFVFEDVAPGAYAIAAFQDTNGNGRLDRTGLGLPLEPFGFSGETARAARPDFTRARFGLREPGATLRVRLARALPQR